MFKKTLTVLCFCILITTSSATHVFATRRAYINDLQKVCTWQYSGSTAILQGSTVYNWKCRTTSGAYKDLSIYGYCQYKYGSNANASFDDVTLPYSWYCTY